MEKTGFIYRKTITSINVFFHIIFIIFRRFYNKIINIQKLEVKTYYLVAATNNIWPLKKYIHSHSFINLDFIKFLQNTVST